MGITEHRAPAVSIALACDDVEWEFHSWPRVPRMLPADFLCGGSPVARVAALTTAARPLADAVGRQRPPTRGHASGETAVASRRLGTLSVAVAWGQQWCRGHAHCEVAQFGFLDCGQHSCNTHEVSATKPPFTFSTTACMGSTYTQPDWQCGGSTHEQPFC